MWGAQCRSTQGVAASGHLSVMVVWVEACTSKQRAAGHSVPYLPGTAFGTNLCKEVHAPWVGRAHVLIMHNS